jgi:hypothetical protein
MSLALKSSLEEGNSNQQVSESPDLAAFLPPEVLPLDNPQTDIPRIAKDEKLICLIEEAVREFPRNTC